MQTDSKNRATGRLQRWSCVVQGGGDNGFKRAGFGKQSMRCRRDRADRCAGQVNTVCRWTYF